MSTLRITLVASYEVKTHSTNLEGEIQLKGNRNSSADRPLGIEGGATLAMEEATSTMLQLVKVTRHTHLPTLNACGRVLRGEAAVIVGITAVVYGIGSIIVRLVRTNRHPPCVHSCGDGASVLHARQAYVRTTNWRRNSETKAHPSGDGKTVHVLRPKSSSKWITTEMDAYQEGYPSKADNPKLNDNLRFYENEIPFKPRGVLISEIHRDWFGDYRLLERRRSYMQWLFPVRGPSRNKWTQELQAHEAQVIKGSMAASARVLRSYEMMLDFYGMRLKNEMSGTIERAGNWQERFHHLNSSYHNYLRITRMLKCLGELGYERLTPPFLEFILHEAIETETLSGCLDSCIHFWLGTIRSTTERKRMVQLADNLMKVHDKRDNCCVIGPADSGRPCSISDCAATYK